MNDKWKPVLPPKEVFPSSRDEPRVTIGDSYRISFNVKFVKENSLNREHKYYLVLEPHDMSRGKVRLAFIFSKNGKELPDQNWGQTVWHQKAERFHVEPKRWFKHYSLTPQAIAGEYEPSVIADAKLGKIYYIDVDKR